METKWHISNSGPEAHQQEHWSSLVHTLLPSSARMLTFCDEAPVSRAPIHPIVLRSQSQTPLYQRTLSLGIRSGLPIKKQNFFKKKSPLNQHQTLFPSQAPPSGTNNLSILLFTGKHLNTPKVGIRMRETEPLPPNSPSSRILASCPFCCSS